MTRRIAAAVSQNLWELHKRQSIQDAVIRLMCREGLQSVTMERVAQEVGIAKGTVYLHYRDKQQLLDEVKDSALDPLVERIAEVVNAGSPPERTLHAYALRYLTYFDESRDLFRILLYEREATRVTGKRYQTGRYRKLVEFAAGAIREGIRSGDFREVNARLVAAMFVDSIVAIVNQRLLTDKPAAVEDDAALIADIFVRGMASECAQRRRSAR
jgi:AcrR family transcriptional regulator